MSTAVRLDATSLDRFLRALADAREVFAPVAAADGRVEFARVHGGEGVDSSRMLTGLSPKGLFFPEAEVLFRYDRGGILPVESPGVPIAVWGMRGCDARGLALLDRVFGSAFQKPGDERFEDPYWKSRYDRATIFGTVCPAPLSTCFCNWFGGSPSSTAGIDVQATDLGEAWLLSPVTAKGAGLLGTVGDLLSPATARDVEASREIAIRAQSALPPPPSLEGLEDLLTGVFHDPAWEGIAAPCVQCGACTFSCPTCHCFDIQDEDRNGRGRRIRAWDSCMFGIFTREASGHNPRAISTQRVRQRVMHKYSYFPGNYGEMLCTGCGRCVSVCPVGFDIRKVLLELVSGAEGEGR